MARRTNESITEILASRTGTGAGGGAGEGTTITTTTSKEDFELQRKITLATEGFIATNNKFCE